MARCCELPRLAGLQTRPTPSTWRLFADHDVAGRHSPPLPSGGSILCHEYPLSLESASGVLQQLRGELNAWIYVSNGSCRCRDRLHCITQKAEAQVSVDIGVAPDCPYGYYDGAPYNCAPSGYYGPEWFNWDSFTGAGPWFHGASDFQGNVNKRLHPEHGYKGPTPQRGEKAEPSKACR